MRVFAFLGLLALAACGVEGRPTAPNGTQPSAAVMLTGSTTVVSGEGL